MGDLGRHADALAQRRVRMDGFTDIHGIGTHFNGQGDLADHVAGVGAHDAAAQDAAMTLRLDRKRTRLNSSH